MPLKSFAKIATTPVDGQTEENVINEVPLTITDAGNGNTSIEIATGTVSYILNNDVDTQFLAYAPDSDISFTVGQLVTGSTTGAIGTVEDTLEGTVYSISVSSGGNIIGNGQYLTGLNASNIASGTISNSYTSAASSNGASTIVARDASGNFSAGTITATLTGTATGLAGTPNITVGTITSGAIAATGAITATGEITAYFSDRNLKKDIVEIQDPIAKVMSIRGVTFRPNETALALGVTDKEEVGVIAQEVEGLYPDLVMNGLNGKKAINYNGIIPIVTAAVQDIRKSVPNNKQLCIDDVCITKDELLKLKRT